MAMRKQVKMLSRIKDNLPAFKSTLFKVLLNAGRVLLNAGRFSLMRGSALKRGLKQEIDSKDIFCL